MWSLYILICPIDNIVRYVGITERTVQERVSEHLSCAQKENLYKFNWLNKINVKPRVVVVRSDLTKQEACKYEIEIIALYRYLVGEKLTNIHEGGNVPPRAKKGTKKHKTDKMSLAAKKRFERKEEREHLSKIRIDRGLAKGEKNPMFGKKRPQVGLKNQEIKGKKIAKILDDVIIEEYNSCAEAARINGLDRANVSKCCYQQNKRAGGFYWKFL